MHLNGDTLGPLDMRMLEMLEQMEDVTHHMYGYLDCLDLIPHVLRSLES
jgi:hypothetical protein